MAFNAAELFIIEGSTVSIDKYTFSLANSAAPAVSHMERLFAN